MMVFSGSITDASMLAVYAAGETDQVEESAQETAPDEPQSEQPSEEKEDAKDEKPEKKDETAKTPEDKTDGGSSDAKTPKKKDDTSTKTEDEQLKKSVIKATLIKEELYKDNKEQKKTKEYKRVNSFWKSLTGRKADSEGDDIDLEVTVSGKLPEGTTAEAGYISLKDGETYKEKGLFSLDITLFDKNGKVYIPEEPVEITVKGAVIDKEISDKNALIAYSYEEAALRSEEYTKKLDKNTYAADASVYRSEDVDKKLLYYKAYDKDKAYKDGEDAVRFTNKKAGLDQAKDSVTFKYNYQKKAESAENQNPVSTLSLVVTSQMASRTLEARAGKTIITVTGNFAESVTLQAEEIGQKSKAYTDYVEKTADALDEDADELLFARAFDIKLIDPETKEEFQPDSKVKVSIRLTDEEIDEDTALSVVHFEDAKDKTPEIMDVTSKDDTVKFSTDGFSVYVLAGGLAGAFTLNGDGDAKGGDKIPLTITADNDIKLYDGTPLTCNTYDNTDLADGDYIDSLTITGSQTVVGKSANVPSNAVIKNSQNQDVTDNYEITYENGELEVTPRSITIRADSASKVSDGTALTKDSFTNTELAGGDSVESVTITGSQTDVGTSANVPSDAVIKNSSNEDVTGSYEITYENGTLTVLDGKITIKADDVEKEYDGQSLTDNKYSYDETLLADGDHVESVNTTVPDGSINVGEYDITASDAVIVNAEGDDVTSKYTVEYRTGKLIIVPKGVTLIANSATKQFNNEEQTVSGYTCSVSGLEFTGVEASGKGTDIGSYDVTFTGVTVDETRDTTGNYVVAETINGRLVIVDGEAKLIKKELTEFTGDIAKYMITVNPEGADIGTGDYITLQDTFSDNQSINYGSITVLVNGSPSTEVSYDYYGYTGTFIIPDESVVTVTYRTRVKGNAGQDVSVNNTAEIGDMSGSSFVGIDSATVEETETISPTGSDISGTGGVYTIDLFVYAEGHMEDGLNGAVFRLLDSNEQPMTYKAGPHAGEEITFETGTGSRKGYVTIQLDEATDGVSIHKNTAYYLEMITAPYEHKDGEDIYYQKDNTLYSFLITDDPDYTYGGIYSFFNGDVLKVRCYPISSGVNVTKRFSGNYELTDEQKNAIKFTLQREALDTASGWVDEESHLYSEFTYGSFSFEAGKHLEEGSTYRVIEENALPDEIKDKIELNDSATLSYQVDGRPVEEDTNEFLVDPDHDSHSYNLLFTNEYVDHKLTIVKLDENTGETLPGAEFTVYKALDDTPVPGAVYRTETEIIEEDGEQKEVVKPVTIRFSDSGADYKADTLYYAKETGEPENYVLPKDPEKVYFYYPENSSSVPQGLPSGATATDLKHSYNTVTIANTNKTVDIPVTATWGLDESDPWPDEVDHIVVGLYQSVNGSTPEPVKNKSGVPMTIELSKDQYYDTTSFKGLPATDDDDNIIDYSLQEEAVYDGAGSNIISRYAYKFHISGTGWYVINNQGAVSVRISKQWFDLNGTTPISDTTRKPSVRFDLYRTTSEASLDHDLTHDEVLALIGSSSVVKSGFVNNTSWTETIDSLEATDKNGNPYYYFVIESPVPDNQEDTYNITPASGSDPRSIIIKNTQTPSTVTIKVNDISAEYGEEIPPYTFNATVMEEGSTVAVSGPDADGSYTATVTREDETTRDISFTVSREESIDVGEHTITPAGDPLQEGYRVLYETGTLTITKATVTITAGGSKTYGDEGEETLVTVEGLKYDDTAGTSDADTVKYKVSREEGEDAGEYKITLEGDTDQGNYTVVYVRTDGEGKEIKYVINRAKATVKAEDASKQYGEDDPELHADVEGLKLGDAPTVISFDLVRDEGESIGEYAIAVKFDGDPQTDDDGKTYYVQGNYDVYSENATFTISGASLVVKVEDDEKVYGDDDPEWNVTLDGLQGSDEGGTLTSQLDVDTGIRTYTYTVVKDGTSVALLTFTVSRAAGEDVNENGYTITPVFTGEAKEDEDHNTYYVEGNYNVYPETGTLTIVPKELTVTPDHIVKAVGVADDPLLTASVTGWAFDDAESEASSTVDTATRTVTWTYKLGGKTILTFTLHREPGEEEGDYNITAAGEENQGNYTVIYEQGTFSILSVLDIDVTAPVVDPVDSKARPSYSYTAKLDLTGTGLDEYEKNGFSPDEHGVPTRTFTLPNEESDTPFLETLKVPAGAKLTVTQDNTNDDYITVITIDGDPYEDSDTECVINNIDTYYGIAFTHRRISLPLEAKAGVDQTEEGAETVLPTGATGIPAGEDKTAVMNSTFADRAAASIGYRFPAGKYYAYDHASLYSSDGEPISGASGDTPVYAIKYVADGAEAKWQYRTESGEFTDVPAGAVLTLFYLPKYICRVDDEKFYSLNDAFTYIKNNHSDKTGTIKMLIGEYAMPSDDSLTIPNGYNITITTATSSEWYEGEPGSTAVIKRSASFTEGHMLKNESTLTLDRVTLDGNHVTATDAMVLNSRSGGSPTLNVNQNAVLQNASGDNGGAIYVNNGTVNINGTLDSNKAANGGAVYVNGGTVTITGPVTGNEATNGGAVYTKGGTTTFSTSAVAGNKATNGAVVYMESGSSNYTVTLSGTIGDEANQNTATNGGVIYVTGGTANITGTVHYNNATSGGVAFVTGGTVNVNNSNSNITENSAVKGGAFYLEGGTLGITNGSVSSNTASSDGGMLYATNGTVNISGGTIRSNTATDGNGGAINYAGSGVVTITGGTIQQNTAPNGFGGAVYQSSGTVNLKSTINGANSAKNGAAVYVDQAGIANFNGCNITGNTATEGGAVGMGSTSATMNFAGNAVITGNTSDISDAEGGKCNVYLDQDSDLVINTAGLGGSANIGIYATDNNKDDNEYERSDACGKFGTYTVNTNLSKFTNDRHSGLTAVENNYKIVWSKAINVAIYRVSNGTLPTGSNGSAISGASFTYYPKSQENAMYNLVMEMYTNAPANNYKNKLNGNDLYAYSFIDNAGDFKKFLTEVNWNTEDQVWESKQHDNTISQSTSLRVYYAQGAYISIVNNSGNKLTIDPMTVLAKNAVADGYGYSTARNYITLDTLNPVTAGDLTLEDGEAIKLLFPSAVGKAWSLTGLFTDADGNPVANTSFSYTLDRTHGGTEASKSTDGNGKFTLSGNTNGTAGGTYEILFGQPTKICKVMGNDGVYHPFPTLNEAWDYIVNNNLTTDVTYKKNDGTTETKNNVPGGRIEMLVDYLQPLSDVLKPGVKKPNGYYLELTTAEAGDGELDYKGGTDDEGNLITRATISRDSDNDGAAVIAEVNIGTATSSAEACNAFVTLDNITFDGKALAKKGNGGAVSTINNVVSIKDCEFKGYQAARGGAVFVMWGGVDIRDCTFSNCVTGDSNDKTGGGAIWTTAKVLRVKDCDFDHCDCEPVGTKSQAGAVFHNIQQSGKPVYNNAPSNYAKYPNNYYQGTKTYIDGCNFSKCYAEGGSGGTIESDALEIYLESSTFDGSYSNKASANGGAINILHNNEYQDSGNYSPLTGSKLIVYDCSFKNCQTQKTGSRGGAIQASNTAEVKIMSSSFENVSSFQGGAVRMGASNSTLEIYSSTFKDCNGKTEAGAVYTPAKTLTIGDEYTYTKTDGTTVTVSGTPCEFTDCTSPKYGGVWQTSTATDSSAAANNSTFTTCSSTNSEAGAIYTAAKTLTLNGCTFDKCTATKDGGAVYHASTSDTLNNVEFKECTSGKGGGGAYLASTTINITGGKFEDCTAQSTGGGVYLKSTATISGCDFTNDTVLDTSGLGGGIYFDGTKLDFYEGTISGCSANNGGGIYQRAASNGVTIHSGSITDCNAASGAGYYKNGGNLTINGGSITDCEATENGGGIYNNNGAVYIYIPENDDDSKISGCKAKNGGGIYLVQSTLDLGQNGGNSKGVITGCEASENGGGIYIYNTSGLSLRNTSSIEDCLAKEAGGAVYHRAGTFGIYGSAYIENCVAGSSLDGGDFSESNLGGGVYQAGGTFNFYADSADGRIDSCKAYNGGGVYHASGTYNNGGNTNKTGNIIKCDAKNEGGGIYHAGGTGNVTIAGGVIGGSEENANKADKGAGVFVADGATASFNNGGAAALDPQITYNHARVEGGGIAVGGSTAVLNFGNKFTVQYNTMGASTECNVYLDVNSNTVIRNSALSADAYIGVYASDEQDPAHGEATKPFATRSNDANLDRYRNDRHPLTGAKGTGSLVVWTSYVCKITDGSGHMLYLDAAHKNPAVYTTLENNGEANKTSAYGMLMYADPELYNADGSRYSGSYQIQMYVQEYTTENRMGTPQTFTAKTITLTTASPEPDEAGFSYNGDPKHPYATIVRGGTFDNAWITVRDDLTLKNVILDGAEKPSVDRGAIIAVKGSSGAITVGENATIKNGYSTQVGGGAIALYESGNTANIYGGTIENCRTDGNGGAIFTDVANTAINMKDGTIKGCSAKNGGAVYIADVSASFNMYSGSITECSATTSGGAVAVGGLNARLHFGKNGDAEATGLCTVIGNTCTSGGSSFRNNVELAQDSNDIINASGINADSEIGIYVPGDMDNPNSQWGKHGGKVRPFGTRDSSIADDKLYCFVNDREPSQRGFKSETDPDNILIYWHGQPLLRVSKKVESDLSADKSTYFRFMIRLTDNSGNPVTFDRRTTFEDITFETDGTAEITLKDGESKTAALPDEFLIDNTYYTVSEELTEEQQEDYITKAHEVKQPVPEDQTTEVSGRLGENIDGSDDSTSMSHAEFINDRVTGEITIVKTVESDEPDDFNDSFDFTITLGDTTISKAYPAFDSNGDEIPDGITFTNGVGHIGTGSNVPALKNLKSITIKDLPTDLPYDIVENLTEVQSARVRTTVKKDSHEEAQELLNAVVGDNVITREGKEVYSSTIIFKNNFLEIVCKILNRSRELLYYRDGNGVLQRAVFSHLEDAFDKINIGNIRTSTDGNVTGTLRVEMIVPAHTTERPAELVAGKTVILTTALTTDEDLFPYNKGKDDGHGNISTVTRGFDHGSMIHDSGVLTIDKIILDGGSTAEETPITASADGGIVDVAGAVKLTVNSAATLQNSKVTGNGGAIRLGNGASLTMSGTIDNCEANSGGGVYAASGFTTIATTGVINECRATAGNGGAICAETGGSVSINAGTELTGNTAAGNGGAVYSEAGVFLRGTVGGEEDGKGNSAAGNGGGICTGGTAACTLYQGSKVIGNSAANGGGLSVSSTTKISGSTLSNNTVTGNGGAIYTTDGAAVTLAGSTSLEGNSAATGGAAYVQGTLTMNAGSMKSNNASVKGGAVFVAGSDHTFTMSGGEISGNVSPAGAVASDEESTLQFSGNAKVIGNTSTDNTTKMNVYLEYDSNDIIHTTGLGSGANIGVYVADGEDIYYKHGIAARNFGTYDGSNVSGARLNKFKNDRDDELLGMDGEQISSSSYFVMWQGKPMRLSVLNYQTKDALNGVTFTFTNIDDGKQVWSGSSNADGNVVIPWGQTTETEGGNKANFKPGSKYRLEEQATNESTVRPAGYWEVTIGNDNSAVWITKASTEQYVNRTIDIAIPEDRDEKGFVGDIFKLYNDSEPTITYDPKGGKLSGGELNVPRTDTINFTTTETYHIYTIDEVNPTWDSHVFMSWATPDPDTSAVYDEYAYEEQIRFFRGNDADTISKGYSKGDMTLYARWEEVICKITDRDGVLLYINGSPAVYNSLEGAFDDINNSSSTTFKYADGTKATARMIKMLIGSYELNNQVQLARGKTVALTTASPDDTDGYAYTGRSGTYCTIKRGADLDDRSMIINHAALTVTNITLDGNNKVTVNCDGGIIKVVDKSAQLTIGTGATLQHSKVTGKGGAVYVSENTTLTMNGGTIRNNSAGEQGAGIYLTNGSHMNISGTPHFSHNVVEMSNYEDKLHGGEPYGTNNVNVDIYLAETGTEDDNEPKTITITGSLLGGTDIWVWADNEYHNKQFMPFAKMKSGVKAGSNKPSVFRNARDDTSTENATGDVLYGEYDSADVQIICWNGIRGTRRVILRKVAAGSYDSLAGAKFIIYADRQGTRVAHDANGDPLGSAADPLVSGESGVFFAGDLNYGTYYVKEIEAPAGYDTPANGYYFIVTVNENGVGYEYTENGEKKIDKEVSVHAG